MSNLTVILNYADGSKGINMMLDGMFIIDLNSEQYSKWWMEMFHKHKPYMNKTLVLSCRMTPKRSYRVFVKRILDDYPNTDMRQFTAKYMEIFNLKPDAGIITELI